MKPLVVYHEGRIADTRNLHRLMYYNIKESDGRNLSHTIQVEEEEREKT